MDQVAYDAVVLAAGKNARLRGVMPAYHKPLITVGGRPLVVNIVNDLLFVGVKHVVVVVSPENCAPITEVLADNDLLNDPGRVTLVVQPTARGPGEGLLRALRACDQPRVLLALADNVIPISDYARALRTDNDCLTVGGHPSEKLVVCSSFDTTSVETARRFTRIADVGRGKLQFVEDVDGGAFMPGFYRCWVGPMIFDRQQALTLFGEAAKIMDPAYELKISRLFNRIIDVYIKPVLGTSEDIGTKDALLQLREVS